MPPGGRRGSERHLNNISKRLDLDRAGGATAKIPKKAKKGKGELRLRSQKGAGGATAEIPKQTENKEQQDKGKGELRLRSQKGAGGATAKIP